MTKSDKRQIILIQGPESESGYSDIKFIEAVTNWDEVTQEEFDILSAMQWAAGFRIVERNPVHPYPSKAGLRTPRDYIDQWRQEQAEREARNSERRKKDAETKLQRKQRQFERLKKELGEK